MAHEELIRWSNDKGRPKWQRDALRRIAGGGGGEADALVLRKIIEKEVGLTDEQVPDIVPLSESDLSNASADTPCTTLASLGPVDGFDRLESDQEPLKFSRNGLTVVYGPNASGKSGYCRIAKKFCRSLSPEQIRRNVYEDDSTSEQSVKLSYFVEGNEQEFTWKVDGETPDELSRISVFDAASARVYVDDSRKLEFLPYELELLSKLGSLIVDMETHYRERRDIINRAKSDAYIASYNEGTTVRSFLERLLSSVSLSDLPTESELRKLAEYSNNMKEERRELEKQLKSDPAAQVSICNMIKGKLEEIQREVVQLSTALGNDGVQKLIDAFNEKVSKAKVAQNAASGILENLPISGVGSNSWVHMLQYAREFAAEVYPDKDDPKISNGEYCVLCQQTLGEEASKRLAKFDDYMLQRSQAESEKANEQYGHLVDNIKGANIMPVDQVKESLLEYEKMSDFRKEKFNYIIEFYTKINSKIVVINDAIESEDFSKIMKTSIQFDDIMGCVQSAVDEISKQLEELKEISEAGEERIKKINRRLEVLVDVERLSQEIGMVIEHRKQIVELMKLEKAISLCATRGITAQINKRTEELLTESLMEKLSYELNALLISHIPIVPEKKGKKGEKSSIRIKLKTRKEVKNSHILSEGEQRSLALACFFAELSEMGSKHGIIIDDPVSSLDHERMDAVAKRLADEARSGRQVIVFTHSISFYHIVKSIADQVEVEFSTRTISSLDRDRFGMIDIEGSEPGNLKRVKERMGEIREKISKLRKCGFDSTQMKFEKDVNHIYFNMRKAWERIVEEILFNEAIKRFEPGVSTRMLRSAYYTPKEDYREIDKGMTECSKFSGHDWADELPQFLPSIEKIQSDFNDLDEFYKKVSKRRSEYE